MADLYRCNNCKKGYVGNSLDNNCPFCGGAGNMQALGTFRCNNCNNGYVGNSLDNNCPFCGGAGIRF